MKRLHIVGCPRSGTTLMLELLASCFENDGHCAFEQTIYKEPAASHRLYFSKRPTDVKIIAPILREDPDLYVIHMVRDPRSVICSIHPSSPDKEYFCDFRLWADCDRAARKISRHPRCLTLRYEDLLTDPDDTQRQILERFSFLRAIQSFRDYHLHSNPSPRAVDAMKGLRPLSRSHIDSWKSHLSRIKAELLRYPELAEALQFHGYEKDARWQGILEGVDPEFSSSRHRTKKHLLKAIDWRIRNWRKLRRKLRGIRRRRLERGRADE